EVEAALLGMQAEDAWRRSLPQRVLAEGVLDRCHAFVRGEQPLDIAARQEEHTRGVGRRGCKAGGESDSVGHKRTPSPKGLGAALGTETVCLVPGACIRPG